MHLRPRNPKRDRLVNEPLAAYSYFQIGECPGAGKPKAHQQGHSPALGALTVALVCSGFQCLHLILGLCHSLSPYMHMIVSMVPCPFSVSGPVLRDPVSGCHLLLCYFGFSVSLCVLSLVSLSISLAILVSLCMSLHVCQCLCFCLSHVTVSVSLSLCVCP